MSDLTELGFGLLLGFTLTVPPGPMNALIAARSAMSFRRGFLTGLGAMSADLVLGTAVYLLQSQVDLSEVVRYIYALGAIVMAYLGVRLLTAPPPEAPGEPAGLRTYSSGLLVGLSNPFQILWWLTAGIAFAYLGGVVLLVGLFGAIAIWVVGFSWAMHAGVHLHPRLPRAVTVVSAAILLGFAVYFAVLAAV